MRGSKIRIFTSKLKITEKASSPVPTEKLKVGTNWDWLYFNSARIFLVLGVIAFVMLLLWFVIYLVL